MVGILVLCFDFHREDIISTLLQKHQFGNNFLQYIDPFD